METVLDISAGRVFYDGLLTEPMLDHPEGLAVHRDGSVWCGGERGQVYRIEPDGRSIEQVARTEGGFSHGMAFDADDNLYVCDLKHAAVLRLDAKSGSLETFADGADARGINICNYPAFDAAGNLYVSDSHAFKEPGPGIFRFSSDGSGGLWYGEPVNFANGLALSPDGDHLYVAETFGHAIFRPDTRGRLRRGTRGSRRPPRGTAGWAGLRCGGQPVRRLLRAEPGASRRPRRGG